MKLVPELLCTDISETKRFYTEVLGFEIKYERPEEKFVYFTRDGIDLMFEEAAGPGRRWITGELDRPFGRGINFQCDVVNAERYFDEVRNRRPESIYLNVEMKSYECGSHVIEQAQFLVQDPDGYLFRFCSKSEQHTEPSTKDTHYRTSGA